MAGDRELDDIRQSAADADLSWLKPWLPEAPSRDSELLQPSGPGAAPTRHHDTAGQARWLAEAD